MARRFSANYFLTEKAKSILSQVREAIMHGWKATA